MGMMVSSDDSEDDVIGTINTTPLVDIMLVLLIIFLITVPVAIHTVPVKLPEEKNTPYANKPENIQLAVNKNGDVFWNEKYIGDVLFGKTFTDDSFKRKVNRGDKNQYFMEGHHPAIIDKETFEQAQLMLIQNAKSKILFKMMINTKIDTAFLEY